MKRRRNRPAIRHRSALHRLLADANAQARAWEAAVQRLHSLLTSAVVELEELRLARAAVAAEEAALEHYAQRLAAADGEPLAGDEP